MFKLMVSLMIFVIGGCASFAGLENSDPKLFYESKAELETKCRNYAQELFPGYPSRRGVLTNYWFTRVYDQCLERKSFN